MTSSTISVRNLFKSFGAGIVLERLSFDIAEGECVALLGPSGCGKTTTLRILAGFETPDFGTIEMLGSDMLRLKPYERNLGLVFQDYALFPHMTVEENIEYGMRRRGVPRAERVARRQGLISLVQLEGLESRRPAQLSGGQQQRLAIARALAPRPALLLLDEPLSNLDTRLRLFLRQSLRKTLAATGATTLLVTHDQEEAMSMADRIVLLDKGRLQQVGAPKELYERPTSRFAAEFLGPCVFLAAERLDAPVSGRGTAQLRDGTVIQVAAATEPPKPAGAFGVMIRPERMVLHASGTPPNAEFNRLAARVVAKEFLGASEELTLELTTGDIMHLREPAACSQTQVGSHVLLDVPFDACLLLPDQYA